MNDSFRDICRLYDMYSVLGLSSEKSPIVCPLPGHIHHSNTPSFSIGWRDGVQHFYCFGSCGKMGDVIDLVGYMKVPGYNDKNKDDVQRAISILTQGFSWSPPKKVEEVRYMQNDLWEKYAPPGSQGMAFAKKRGLSSETIQKFRLGQKGSWLTIPAFEDGVLIGIKLRNLVPGLRYTYIKGSKSGVFNYDAVAWKPSPFLLVKGEIAAMVCVDRGLLACAPTAGERMKVDHYTSAFSCARKIVVVGDNDPGEIGEMTRQMAVDRAKALKGDVRFPPPIYKDIDEWILDDPGAVDEIRSWL